MRSVRLPSLGRWGSWYFKRLNKLHIVTRFIVRASWNVREYVQAFSRPGHNQDYGEFRYKGLDYGEFGYKGPAEELYARVWKVALWYFAWDFSSHPPLIRQFIKKCHCSVSFPTMNFMKTRVVVIHSIGGMSLNRMDEKMKVSLFSYLIQICLKLGTSWGCKEHLHENGSEELGHNWPFFRMSWVGLGKGCV